MTELLDNIVKLLSYNYYTDNKVITMFNYLIQEGKLEGIQEGMQKGKLEAQLEIAKQMLITGMDRQSVMKFTGLTDTEMSNLFKD